MKNEQSKNLKTRFFNIKFFFNIMITGFDDNNNFRKMTRIYIDSKRLVSYKNVRWKYT